MINPDQAKKIAEFKGENGHQSPAALFALDTNDELSISNFKVIEGSDPSYNNYRDLDRLLQTITHIAAGFEVNFKKIPKITVGAKHGNPCGAAVDENSSAALSKMLAGNPRAIFGGSIITNFAIDEEEASALISAKVMLDCIIVPAITPAAIELLKRKGGKCRFVINPALQNLSKNSLDSAPRFTYTRGGWLEQQNYTFVIDLESSDMQKFETATDHQKEDMVLAWAIGSTSNSNTISLVKGAQLIGNGVGQQDRVGAAELAIKIAKQSGHDTEGAVAYSDSFFPFNDGPKTLIDAGIKAILTSSGSIRDKDTSDLCIEKKVALYMIPDALGRGFYAH